MAARRERILKGPILDTILVLAAPNVLGVAAQTAVAIADAIGAPMRRSVGSVLI